jgi:hypothetical protein
MMPSNRSACSWLAFQRAGLAGQQQAAQHELGQHIRPAIGPGAGRVTKTKRKGGKRT